MTNRPKSTTDSDQQIAARIKIFREGLRWSQSDFARMLDLSRNMVANIESGRTPLRYDVAWEISEKFDYQISRMAFDDPSDIVFLSARFPPPESSLLSKQALLKDVATAVKSGVYGKPSLLGPGMIPGVDIGGKLHQIWSHLTALVWQCATETPIEKLAEMDHLFTSAAEAFLQSLPREPRDNVTVRASALNLAILRYKHIVRPYFSKTDQKSFVDSNTHTADTSGVLLTWKELKNRLKKVTAVRGQKAAAAKFIGVDRSNLNRWLDDDQEPGAEATFRLLEWVTAEEAKQPSPTSASTPVEPKTQPKDTNESKLKPSRKKK